VLFSRPDQASLSASSAGVRQMVATTFVPSAKPALLHRYPSRGSRYDRKNYLPPIKAELPRPDLCQNKRGSNIDMFFANIACCT
jgi:hypothetical protein